MIIGIGNDLIDIRRIERTLERFGDRFIERIFTPLERTKAERRRNRVETYAKRFAAKEACSKALGTGFRRGVYWRDLGVINLPGGKPSMELTGGALKRLATAFRGLPIPVLGRISDDSLHFDLRCLEDEAAWLGQLTDLRVQ